MVTASESNLADALYGRCLQSIVVHQINAVVVVERLPWQSNQIGFAR